MSNRLDRLGIRVLQFPCERLADYAPMRARLAALCGLVPRRMLAVVQREPMIVAGKETLPDDVLAEVGCANAVTNRKGYFVLSPEARVKLAPDGEVDFSMDYDLTRLGPKLPAAIAELRRRLEATGGTPVASVAGETPATPNGQNARSKFRVFHGELCANFTVLNRKKFIILKHYPLELFQPGTGSFRRRKANGDETDENENSAGPCGPLGSGCACGRHAGRLHAPGLDRVGCGRPPVD
jgi:hypothetical protein